MRYSRSRSRPTADEFISVKKGTVASQTFTVDIESPYHGFLNQGAPDTIYRTTKYGQLSAAGVTTFLNTGTYRRYYDSAQLFARTKTFQDAILAVELPVWKASLEASLSGYTPPLLKKVGREDMSDTVDTEYSQKKSRGEIIASPMTYFSYSAEASTVESKVGFTDPVITWQDLGTATRTDPVRGNCSVNYYRLSCTIGINTEVIGVPVGIVNQFESQLNLSYMDGETAINQSHARVSQAEADLALFLAELRKTASLFALTAARIASLVRKIKTGSFAKLAPHTWSRYLASSKKGSASPLDFFTDAWLEARYAWRPLVMDASDAYMYLQSLSSSSRRTFRAFDQEQETDDDYTASFSDGTYTYNFTGVLTTDRFVRAGVLTEIDPDFLRSSELGFLNPAGLAWELIPYSFVVDWFVDVSGLIAACNPNQWFKILTSWASYTTEQKFIGVVEITNPSTSITKSVNFKLTKKIKKREIDTEPSLINFDVNLDVLNMVDAVALLRRFKH